MPVSSKHVPYDLGLRWSQRLHKALKQLTPSTGQAPSLMTCQAALARMLGHAHWHAYEATRQVPGEALATADPASSSIPAMLSSPLTPEEMPASLKDALTTIAWRDGTTLFVERRGDGTVVVQTRENGLVRGFGHRPQEALDWLVWAERWPGYEEQRLDLILAERSIRLMGLRLPTMGGDMLVLRLSLTETPPTVSTLGFPPALTRSLEQAVSRAGEIVVLAGNAGSGASTTLLTLRRYAQRCHDGRARVHDLMLTRGQDDLREVLQALPQGAAGEPQMIASPLDLMDDRALNHLVSLGQPDHGPLVLGRLHTASATGALRRLVDLGLTPDRLAELLPRLTVVHQRLVPLVCPHCSRPTTLALEANPALAGFLKSPLQRAWLDAGEDPLDALERLRWQGAGCGHCRSQGVRGRTALVETFSVRMLADPRAEDTVAAFVRGQDWDALERWWNAQADRPLRAPGQAGARAWHHGLEAVAQGRVSPESLNSTFHGVLTG